MADMSPEADLIEADIAKTRARMDDRLDQLKDHLSPKQLINDAYAYFRGEDGADITQELVDRARANPLPLALVGVGIAWLMAANVSGPTSGAGTSSETARAQPAPPFELSALSAGTVGRAPPLSSNEGSQTMAQSARGSASSLVHNPFALGAIAAVAGAIAGALLPTLEQEETALGGAATKLREKGRDLAQDIVDRGSRVVTETLDAVKGSADAHGLTADVTVGDAAARLKSGDLAADVKAVAQDALHAGQDSAAKNMAPTTGAAPGPNDNIA